MKKLLLISALALGVSAGAWAKAISPETALKRVCGAPQTGMMKVRPQAATMKLARTIEAPTQKGTAMLYVFNKGNEQGYLITPADDLFPAVLGYGDKGSYAAGKVSPAMEDFINDYAREMEQALASQAALDPTLVDAAPDRDPIQPLIKTHWDQGEPYNVMSPKLKLIDSDGNLTGQEIPTVTGCVATSLAQVMYYHKWPDVGVGSNKYEWNAGYRDVQTQNLTCDFGNTRFDWDNMLQDYTTDASGNPTWTDAQAQAVATLMYACGISVNMNYNVEAAGGSGAVSRDQGAALINNFKYSRALRYQYRDYCTAQEFEDIIYSNLAEGLPVLYNGRSSAGGHSFVCDGYAGGHYFHFNWGWSGISDGYFYLGRLNPTTLGIGATASGFNESQGITYNIRPVRNGEDTGEAERPYFNCVGNFDYSSRSESTAANGKKLMFTYFNVTEPIANYNPGFWNMSSASFTGFLGVVVDNKAGYQYFVPGQEFKDLKPNTGTRSIMAYLEEIPEGVYEIRPAYYNTVDEESDYIHVVKGYRDHVYMTVNADGTRTFRNTTIDDVIADAPEMAVTSFNYNGKIYGNVPHEYLITVANHSADRDYYGNLTLVLRNAKGKELTTLPLGRYDVPAGLTMPSSFSLTLDLLKNSYTIGFRDAYGRDLPGEFPLTISEKASNLTTQLRVTTLTPVDMLPGKSADVTFQVGNYGSTDVAMPEFELAWFKLGESSGKSVKFKYSQLTIQSNRLYNLTVNGVPFNLEEGEYEIKMYWHQPVTDADGNVTGTKRVRISQAIAVRSGYPVENVSLDSSTLSLNAGDTAQLSATVAPENATFRILSWVSSNPAVATVDNEGRITAVAKGTAFVSATAHNGSSAVCAVSVGTSGVEDIEAAGAAITAVYTPSGVKVLDAPTQADVDALQPGIYVVATEAGTYKLVK